MAFGRFVVTARVTVAAGTAGAVAQPGGTVPWSNGSGSASKWAEGFPVTFERGTTIYADDTAPGSTPTGPQQLYQAIGAGNLRAYTQGTDDSGHAAYRTDKRRLLGRWCPRADRPKLGYPQIDPPFLWKSVVDHSPGNPPEVFLPHSR